MSMTKAAPIPAFAQRRAGVITARQRGFTLIELLIFIVVVSAGLAGILSVMNTVVKSSADPMVRKQAMTLADSMLEEVLLKAYCDPDPGGASPPTCGPHVVKASRMDYDNVDDYNGTAGTGIDETLSAAGPIFLDMPSELYGYRIQIHVVVPPAAAAKLDALDAKQVTVTVGRGTESVSMTGYRTNY